VIAAVSSGAAFVLARLLRIAEAIGDRLIRLFDALGKSRWVQSLSEWLRAKFGLRVSGIRLALYAAAMALTLLMLPIGLLISPALRKPSETTIEHRVGLLGRLPNHLFAHIFCLRDAELNCLRDPAEFKDQVTAALLDDHINTNLIAAWFKSPQAPLSSKSRAREQTIEARWAFATFPNGQTCALHRTDVMLDTQYPDEVPSTSTSTANGEPPPPSDLGMDFFAGARDWGWSRGEALRALARTLEDVAADRQLIASATGPIPLSSLKFFSPGVIEKFLREIKGLPPLPRNRREIAAAGRFQIDRQKHEEDAVWAVDTTLKAAPLADQRLASALRFGTDLSAPTSAPDQYERFVLALLETPEDRVYVQNAALGLVLASVNVTARSTVARNLAEVRPHLLELGRRLDMALGRTAALTVLESHLETYAFQSQALQKMLSDLGPFRVPRLEVCTQAFAGLPLGLDKALGMPTRLATLIGAALWYPVNAAVFVWQEATSILRADLLTGVVLTLLAGLSFWLAIKVQLDGKLSLFERVGGVLVAILLFPWYLALVVALADLAFSSFTTARNWILGILSIPLVSLFLFLFPKVVTAVTFVPTTVRRFVARR
jgi:hypothetical protein